MFLFFSFSALILNGFTFFLFKESCFFRYMSKDVLFLFFSRKEMDELILNFKD